MESADGHNSHRQIAEAIAGAVGTSAARLGLRYDRVAIRALDHLNAVADSNAPEGTTVLLALTAAIRTPAKTIAALEQEITALLRTGPEGLERSFVLNQNRAELRLVRHAPDRRHKLLGFVHNPDVDATLILDIADRRVRSAV